ncbi:MAG: 4-hydroxy-tetrahydrodipicolinate synthase [Bacteroidetes bacterium ADurb.BinA174]|nr:MAG: 4-hydroxy-tetrahydrodipicolinate synthase [Bacteroidetes bacterium ADurb.BinA174]
MSKVNFRGLGVALVTPFKSDDSIDYNALEKLIDYHLSNGTDYIVALGTTAETPTLSAEEQNKIVSFMVEKLNGRIPLVVGVGGNCTSVLVDKLKKMDCKGISAILSVTPYYNKPTQEGLYQHYCALSAASQLPIILYNVPGRTGVNMSVETTLRIARSCKNVIAIKEASGNINQITEIIKGAPEGFSVISGDDSITTAVIQNGGIGVISVFGNAFPKEMKWLVQSVLEGDAVAARQKMEESFNKLFDLMFIDGNPAGVKCLLSLKGLLENKLRLPLVPVREQTKQEIIEELKKISQ